MLAVLLPLPPASTGVQEPEVRGDGVGHVALLAVYPLGAPLHAGPAPPQLLAVHPPAHPALGGLQDDDLLQGVVALQPDSGGQASAASSDDDNLVSRHQTDNQSG